MGVGGGGEAGRAAGVAPQFRARPPAALRTTRSVCVYRASVWCVCACVVACGCV